MKSCRISIINGAAGASFRLAVASQAHVVPGRQGKALSFRKLLLMIEILHDLTYQTRWKYGSMVYMYKVMQD